MIYMSKRSSIRESKGDIYVHTYVAKPAYPSCLGGHNTMHVFMYMCASEVEGTVQHS